MIRKLKKKVSKVFRKKDVRNGDYRVLRKDYSGHVLEPERPRGPYFAGPEPRTDYPTYDPYIATLPEEPPAWRPLSDDNRNGKLPARPLDTIDDEEL
jgi:hypothetical protein